jgi:hypothetical protein
MIALRSCFPPGELSRIGGARIDSRQTVAKAPQGGISNRKIRYGGIGLPYTLE